MCWGDILKSIQWKVVYNIYHGFCNVSIFGTLDFCLYYSSIYSINPKRICIYVYFSSNTYEYSSHNIIIIIIIITYTSFAFICSLNQNFV